MNTRIIALAIYCFLLSACAGVAKLPTCEEGANLKRINPEWIAEVAEYSIPWDNQLDNDKEKLDSIESLKKNKEPVNEVQSTKKPSLIKNSVKKNNIKSREKPNVKKDKKQRAKKQTKKMIKPDQSNMQGAVKQQPRMKKISAIPHEINSTLSKKSTIVEKNNNPIVAERGVSEQPLDKKAMKIELAKLGDEDSWFLHVASYKNIKFAQKHEKELLGDMLPAYIYTIKRNSTIYYRIIIGPKLTLEQAKAYQDTLFKKYKQNISIYNSQSLFEH